VVQARTEINSIVKKMCVMRDFFYDDKKSRMRIKI
jgi:hypothetical protein